MEMNKFVDFLTKLGISQEGVEQGDKYVIDLGDSNTYSRVYTILDKSELVDLDVENISMTEEESTMIYLSDNYDLTLSANFENNKYTLTIEEAKD